MYGGLRSTGHRLDVFIRFHCDSSELIQEEKTLKHGGTEGTERKKNENPDSGILDSQNRRIFNTESGPIRSLLFLCVPRVSVFLSL